MHSKYVKRITNSTHSSRVYQCAETDDVGRACRHGSRESKGHIRRDSLDTSIASRRIHSVRNQHNVQRNGTHLKGVVMVTSTAA